MISELIDVLISGITNGAVYSIMAAGMALVYGVTKVFNFAYGSFYSLGGYLAWWLVSMGLPYFVVIIGSILCLFAFGWGTEKVLLSHLRQKPNWEMMAVMITLGLAMFMDNLYQIVFGPFVKELPLLIEGQTHVGSVVLSHQDITMFIIAIAVMTAFILFLSSTRLGMTVRAVAQNSTGALIVGVKKDRVFSVTFAVSTVLVGTSGILLAPKYYVSPFGGWDILVKAWVITAFGGMGSIKGSLYAAFILGIMEAFVGYWLGFTWTMFSWFTVLLITLIFRPKGLFGTWG
jgi:branched-chain amino acid transport system permease protein